MSAGSNPVATPLNGKHLEVDDGAQEPGAQQALASGADAAVQTAEHREALLGGADAHGRRVPFLLEDLPRSRKGLPLVGDLCTNPVVHATLADTSVIA